MIKPPAIAGAAFSEAKDGDLRRDDAARVRFSAGLGIRGEWATIKQVHGAHVIEATRSGELGGADALWTRVPELPLAVFTADCLGVVLHSAGAVGVAHVGWRGAKSGVVVNLYDAMASAGHEPKHAALGPGIGPCCFEVGDDVAQFFGGGLATTSWGTRSVDLAGYVGSQLQMTELWAADACTRHEEEWFSHRRDGTMNRMVALAWI